MATPIETFYINGFKSGWRPDVHHSSHAPDAIPDLNNMDFTEGYGLKKRGGIELIVLDDDPCSAVVIDPAEHVFFQKVFTSSGEHPNFTQRVIYLEEDGGTFWIQEFGELLDEWENGTGSHLSDTGHTMGVYDPSGVSLFRYYSLQCITYGTYIYVTGLRFGATSGGGAVDETDNGVANGPSLPFRYDAATATITRPDVHLLDGTTTGFPAARACIVKYDRVFAANVYKISTYRYPSRLIWSDLGTSETFQANSYIDVGGDDGSEITGLLPFGEQILIFKNTSTWVLVGSTEDDFALYSLDNNLGTEATHGFCAHAGKAYFFDSRNGVMAYDGAGFTNISEPINQFMLGRLNREVVYKVGLHVNQDRLFVTMPTFSESENSETFMYDIQLGVWTRWDMGWGPVPGEYFTNYSVAGVGIPQDGAFYAARVHTSASGNPLRGIFKMEEGLNDISAVDTSYVPTADAIDGYFETAWWNPGDVGDRHRIRRLDILSPADTSSSTWNIRRELVAQAWQTGSWTGEGILYDESHIQEVDSDTGLWTWIQFYFENDEQSERMQVNGLGISVSNRKLLRGTRLLEEPEIPA